MNTNRNTMTPPNKSKPPHNHVLPVFDPSITRGILTRNHKVIRFSLGVITLLGIFGEKYNLGNSSLTSHEFRGFQVTPNGPEFEMGWYFESWYIKI